MLKKSVGIAALLLWTLPASPQATQGAPPPRKVALFTDSFDPEVAAAVEKGLAALASRQRPNGSWLDRVGYSLSGTFYGDDDESVYGTSLACMALLAGGNTPGRGKYGRHVARAVEWLSSKCREEDGYITHAGSRMYDHALATLCLAEAYGMTRRSDLKKKVTRAIDLIVNSQNREGGWRHQPTPVDADLSVTSFVVLAMRAARNAGVIVPLDTVEAAEKYVLNCANRRGFGYQPSHGDYDWRTTYAMTAAGVVSLYSLGRYDAEEVRRALRTLANWDRWDTPGRLHYFYAHYLAARALYVAGGDYWAGYQPVIRKEVLRIQDRDGGWEDDVGRNYATAMALLILQTPCEYLSIFQK